MLAPNQVAQNASSSLRRQRLDKAAPWLVSGASAMYVVARAHQLSKMQASDETLVVFLLNQSDLLLTLCGSSVVCYALMDRPKQLTLPETTTTIDNRQIRQLRQIISALTLGIGLLERRLARGAYSELGALVQRLHAIVRQAAAVLTSIDQPSVATSQRP